jgi:hypothetical protein
LKNQKAMAPNTRSKATIMPMIGPMEDPDLCVVVAAGPVVVLADAVAEDDGALKEVFPPP